MVQSMRQRRRAERLAVALQDLIDDFGLDEIVDTEEQARSLQNAHDLLGG